MELSQSAPYKCAESSDSKPLRAVYISQLQLTLGLLLQQRQRTLPPRSPELPRVALFDNTITAMMRSLPLMMLVIFSALTWSAEAKLTNVVTEWINATQARVAVLGVHNVPASRWYAQTALAIHNAVAAGGAPPQALAGRVALSKQQARLKIPSFSFILDLVNTRMLCYGVHVALLAAYAGYTIVSGNFPGSQANYDVLLKKQLAGISEKDRAAAAAIAVPIADEILRDK